MVRLRLGRRLFFQQNLCKQGAYPLSFGLSLATITLLNNMFIIGRIVEWGWSFVACSANEGAMPEDRRITRSKQALRQAFIELTEENGLDGFSASDLCARAGLNRGTLYNIFGDKDGLLRALEGDIMADLEALQTKMQTIGLKDVMRYRVSKRPMPFLVELFDCLREQGDFLHAVLGPKGDPSFGPRVRDALCTEIIQTILHERYRNNPEPFVQYYVSFYASAYLGVITRWVETGMRESSQDMALIAMKLFFIKPGDPIKL